MKNIEIKKAGLTDIQELQKISKQTFFETFSEDNTEENMQKYLSEKFSTEKLTNEINNPYSWFFFVIMNGAVAGYLKINAEDAQTELKDSNALEIERIYVLKDYYGKKAGQFLFDKAFEIAMERKAWYLWLGVWEKNLRAIHFYKKNGFMEFDKHIFKLGDDIQTDLMMKLSLK